MKIFTKEMFRKPSVRLPWQKKIGIMLDRNTALLSTVYHCYIRSITFVLLDTRWPRDRLFAVLQNAGIDTVLTTKKYADCFSGVSVLYIENDAVVGFSPPAEENDMAYYAHTSGTTGDPKCIAISRAALANLIKGISAVIDFTPGKRITCLASSSFDMFILESIGALELGLTVILANEEEQVNPKLLSTLISEGHADIVQTTPSRMRLLQNFDSTLSCLSHVSEILLGGEALPMKLLEGLQKETNAKIYNLYGPTEATVWATLGEVTDAENIHIGRPLPGVEIYITDEELIPVPDGTAGEICIGGAGLAWGYIGKPDLTAEKFLYLSGLEDIKVYRTGDLGRRLPNGNLEYIGRTDNQIKIRGHRIEPEEIEFYLEQIAGVRQAIAVGHNIRGTDTILEAYYVSDVTLSAQDIVQYLEQKLPAYMIPSVYKRVASFPLSPIGKVDRNRVFQCTEIKEENPTAEACFVTKQQEEILAVIASNIIAPDSQVSFHAKLTELGVDSITFIRIVLALEEAFQIEFEDEILILRAFPTVKSLVDYVEGKIRQSLCE